MNGFLVRHAERIKDEPYSLIPKGKERAQKYSKVLYKLFYEKFGEVPEAIYLKAPDEIYGIQCQQTMIPLALEKNLPIIHFKNEVDLELRHKNFILCCEHKMIVHLVDTLCKEKTGHFPFFWSDHNFCTILQIHQGRYTDAFPLYMEEDETKIFQEFMNHVPFLQHCQFLYKKSEESDHSFHHLPRPVLNFLEFFLSVFPHLSDKIQIFGGWIRNILLKEVDPNIHDIDVVFPLEYSVFKEFLDWVEENPSCINLKIYLRRTVREEENIITAHFNFIEKDTTIALDMSNYKRSDFDFTCNSGFMNYPSLDDIGFHFRRGERDLMERRLIPCSPTVGLDRYLKMLTLGFQIVDTEVLRYLKEKISTECHSLTKQEMMELCHYCSLDIPSPILTLSDSLYSSILLLGYHENTVKPTPSYESWLKELDHHLDPCATITTGIYHPDNIITHSIKYLIKSHPSRSVVWVLWKDNKEPVSEVVIKEFRKNIPLGVVKTISNILFRTSYLLEVEHDKIFVYPGKEGTEMEMLTINLMNRSFEKVPIESSSSEVDYIIVGGGSAGCVVAYRLLEAGYSVAVIEASGDNKDVEEVKNPSDYYKLYGPSADRSLDWSEWVFPSQGQKYYRGTGLGGTANINNMVAHRGDPDIYDEWARRVKSQEWDFQHLQIYFEKVLEWLSLTHSDPEPIEMAVQNHVQKHYDNVSIDPVQLMITPEGKRSNSFLSLFKKVLHHPKLSLYTDHLVSEILFSEKDPYCAIGVKGFKGKHLYSADVDAKKRKDGEQFTIHCNKEVIMCGGAFNSPQLLMLSGIGDESHLKEMGIPVRINLPEMGKNLMDHVEGRLDYFVKGWSKKNYSTAYPDSYLEMDFTTIPSRLPMNIFVLTRPSLLMEEEKADGIYLEFNYKNSFSSSQESLGKIYLTSRDPKDKPCIKRSGELDSKIRKASTETSRWIEKMMNHPLAPWDASLLKKDEFRVGNHPCGSCAMGTVVDSKLCVMGMKNLRVVDASIFPLIPSNNISLPIYVVAEKASEMIIEKNST